MLDDKELKASCAHAGWESASKLEDGDYTIECKNAKTYIDENSFDDEKGKTITYWALFDQDENAFVLRKLKGIGFPCSIDRKTHNCKVDFAKLPETFRVHVETNSKNQKVYTRLD